MNAIWIVEVFVDYSPTLKGKCLPTTGLAFTRREGREKIADWLVEDDGMKYRLVQYISEPI